MVLFDVLPNELVALLPRLALGTSPGSSLYFLYVDKPRGRIRGHHRFSRLEGEPLLEDRVSKLLSQRHLTHRATGLVKSCSGSPPYFS